MILRGKTSRNIKANFPKFSVLFIQAFDSDLNLKDMHLVDFR